MSVYKTVLERCHKVTNFFAKRWWTCIRGPLLRGTSLVIGLYFLSELNKSNEEDRKQLSLIDADVLVHARVEVSNTFLNMRLNWDFIV